MTRYLIAFLMIPALAVAQEPVYPSPQSPPAAVFTADPYGFCAWLNGVRAARGLAPVAYDLGLTNDCQANNAHQHRRGLGHFGRRGRRQNVGQGSQAQVCSMWMSSPAHASALLDPSIRRVGIACSGAYWTYEAD